jgi:hypothetical protein
MLLKYRGFPDVEDPEPLLIGFISVGVHYVSIVRVVDGDEPEVEEDFVGDEDYAYIEDREDEDEDGEDEEREDEESEDEEREIEEREIEESEDAEDRLSLLVQAASVVELSERCCCGCGLDVSESHHTCLATGKKCGGFCGSVEGFGSASKCRGYYY